MEQAVLLTNLLTELGLGQAQAADAALHLLHLHLQQRDDVTLLVQLPQQLLRRGARRQRVRVVRRAALHRALLPHRRRQPPGPGPGPSGRPGPQLHLYRQVDGLHVLGRAPCRGLGGGGCTGALRGGGGGGGGSGGAGAAGRPLRLALVDTAQREDGGDPHQVGLAAALEVLAADPVARGGLEGAEAAADSRPGDVLQPEAPQLLVLGEGVEVQRLVAVRVVVAARHAAGEARHGGAASRGRGGTPGRPRRRGKRARGAPAELQLPQGQPRPLTARQRRPSRPHRNYADHDAPRQRRRRIPAPHCAAPPPLPTTAPGGRRCRPRPSREAPRSRERRLRGRRRGRSAAMAESRPAGSRSLRRSGRYLTRAAAKEAERSVLGSGKAKGSRRSILVKQRPAAFPDVSNDTPRLMLKRIIQTQPQVSPLAPRISNHEETEEAQSEPPSKRTSSTVEMQLPDLVPEHTSIATFHMSKRRRKLSISEFERAADKRLPQNQVQSTLDSTILTQSLRMSLDPLVASDTVQKRGLLRRPKNRRAIDMEAFEGGVEQNMLKRKVQDYLVDSQTASGIQTATLTSDVEIMLNNTELFVQPQFGEQSQNKLSALEPQLLDSKPSAQRSKISDAALEEAGLAGLVSSVGSNKRRTQSYSEGHDREHVDRMTRASPRTPTKEQADKQDHSQQGNPMEQLSASPRTPTKEQADKQDHSQQRNPMEQLSVTEEVVAGTAEHHASAGQSEHLEKQLTKTGESQITRAQNATVETEMAPEEEEGIAEGSVAPQGSPEAEHEIVEAFRAGSLGRGSHAFSSSEKSGLKPLKEAVEQVDELEDQAIMVEFSDLVEKPPEDEAEDSESAEVSMKTPMFVRAAAYKPLLSDPRPTKPTSPKSLLRPKPVPKRLGASRRKKCEPAVASSLIKKIFSHYVKMPVARDSFKVIEKCSMKYFKQLSNDLEAYCSHAGRKTVEMVDLEVLMRRQGLVTDRMPLHVLIERNLPLEYRKLLIPVAVSGNKVIPCK
ncbi:LOW QUALITY PROTEIN: centromere protein T [Porphyrio hochstetteri]